MKTLIGLYLEESLYYACVKKSFTGVIPKSPCPGLQPFGIINGTSISCLRDFLEKLTLSKRIAIYLSLPRTLFFVRQINLPSIPLDEALLSIENNLEIYSHLPLEKIYYDVHLCKRKENGINALIFYAERKQIDRYLNVFDETGTRKFLKGIYPVSYGLQAWFSLQKYAFPFGVVLRLKSGHREVAFCSQEGLLSSMLLEPFESTKDVGIDEVWSKLGLEKDTKYLFSLEDLDLGKSGISKKSAKIFKSLPPVSENLAVASLSPPLAKYQKISLDGSPPRIKQFRLDLVIIGLTVFLIFVGSFLTWNVKRQISIKDSEIVRLEKEIKELKKKVEPLRQEYDLLQKAEKIASDVNSYIVARPDLYGIINEIARLVPEGTWFSYFSYEKNTIHLRGISQDALKVIEALRKSDKFDQVKLAGSVSRNREGKESFTLTITLKEVDDKKVGETDKTK